MIARVKLTRSRSVVRLGTRFYSSPFGLTDGNKRTGVKVLRASAVVFTSRKTRVGVHVAHLYHGAPLYG